jgi:hypothetical protein
MCIAIYKPAGIILTKELLQTCFTANKDGAGFAYINESYTGVRKIFIKKSLNFDTFYAQYERATKINPDSPFLIHFRIKTHGPIDKDNCHPFMVDKETVFIHNGIISGVGVDPKKSDTRLFNEKVLQKLPIGWNHNEAIRTLVEDFISHSKLVTMNIEGDIQIFNENKGQWEGGCWFSNSSYKPKAIVKYTNIYHKYTAGSFNSWSQLPCECCGVYHALSDMSSYETLKGTAAEAYCKGCIPWAMDKGWILPNEKVTPYRHAQLLNKLEQMEEEEELASKGELDDFGYPSRGMVM